MTRKGRRTGVQGWGAWVAAAVLTVGCGAAGSTGGTAQAATESALETTHDTTDAPELSDVLTRLSVGPRDEGIESFRCDPNPTVTTVTVCGKEFPASLHFEWTACWLPPGPQANPQCGQGDGPPPAGDGGELAPPQNPGEGSGGGRGVAPTGDGGALDDAPTSSGTVDITTTVASDCSEGGDFNFTESATFAIDRSSPRGSEHVEGSTQSSSSHALEAQDFTKSTALDVTRTRTDADGNTEVVRLSGNLGVAFDASGALPLRTVGGTLSLTLPSGDAVQATLNGVVREPPRVCRTPVGGTIDYADPDGTAHSLSFGPDCGAATLDGEALTLEQTGPGDAARGP